MPDTTFENFEELNNLNPQEREVALKILKELSA